MSWLYSCSFEQ